MIWIRADANKIIGTGHVMRCLSIAMALQKIGREVCFLLADNSAVSLLEAKNQKYMILETAYENMEEEIPVLRQLWERHKPELCLIDSYYVTENYLKTMREMCKTAYMDDMFSFPYPVDLVINYNIYGDLLPYEENAYDTHVSYLLGTDYVPLRDEFCGYAERIFESGVKRVLISTGGSDIYHLSVLILEELLRREKIKDLEYHVICGAFSKSYLSLAKMAEENPQIVIHQNVTKMAELMQMCDVAISAGGSTMYELCAIGVPTICFSFAENQERLVETFVKKEVAAYGGNYLADGEAIAEQIADCLVYFTENPQVCEHYRRKCRALVDGRGAERIAQALVDLMVNGK